MQGVVMEIKEDRCVVLKKDGTFAEIPNRNYTVGQTVTLSRSAVRRSLSLAACLAVVCLAGAGYHLYFTPASYIYLDINPSIRLDLNCFERVIDVVPLNEDAETLLADSTIGKGKVSDCMSAIVSACREQNYLNEDNTDVEVSVRTDNARLETVVEDTSSAIQQENLEVSVYQMDESENESAIEHHISAKRLRAVRAYIEQFGGTLEENLQQLQGLSSDEIYQKIREARRTASAQEQTTPHKPTPKTGNTVPSASAPTTEKQETPNTQTTAKPSAQTETPAQSRNDTQNAESVQTEKPAQTHRPASDHQLSGKRLDAIRAYTEQFGGTLEQNAKQLQGVSSSEIYQMIQDAQNENTGDASENASP